ncbi:MAG: acyl-CoA dehydrogenase protein, partial [Nocardioidaceae bacterium]|nr:acyl-CoA dehydrogenase protein [Nocardioidaceae bacterium]
LALAHARQRRQFGRPIGSFQAVQHRSASTALAIEGARAAMWNSAWEAAYEPEQALSSLHVTMSRSVSASAFVTAAESLIQTLGGIGFTWEHPAHLYYRRALSARLLFLTVEQARERVAAALVDG